MFFLPSPLYGWGVAEILRRIPTDAPVVWAELEPELRDMSRRAFQNNPEAHRLIEWRPESEPLPHGLDFSLFRRVTILALTGGRALHAPEYGHLVRLLEQNLELFWKNKVTFSVLGSLWTRNLWRNLALSRGHPVLTAEAARCLGSGKTAVVLGAGPGLEESLSELKRLRESLFLVATDSALGVLWENGLEPDLCAALEGQVHNLPDFIGTRGKALPVAMDLVSHPGTAVAAGGGVLWTQTEWVPLSLWTRLTQAGFPGLRLPPLGSVGNYAAELALKLSDGPVYHAGLDFSFPEGKTHARGSPHHRRLLARHDRFHPALSGAYGYPTQAHQHPGWRTTPALRGYKAQLESQAHGRLHPLSIYEGGRAPISAPVLNQASFSGKTWNPTAFIQSEAALVEAVLVGLEEANLGRIPDDWDKRMNDADHLWRWFPDAGIPNRESSFLSRVLVESHTWLNRQTRFLENFKF